MELCSSVPEILRWDVMYNSSNMVPVRKYKKKMFWCVQNSCRNHVAL